MDWPQVLAFLRKAPGLAGWRGVLGRRAHPASGPAAGAGKVRALGFATALHTGGMYPERLAAVLPCSTGWGSTSKAQSTAMPTSPARRAAVPAFESLALLQASPVAFECRTTWHAGLYEAQELQALGDQLAGRGVRHWAVQVCRHVPGAPDVTPSTVAAPVGRKFRVLRFGAAKRGAVG